MCVCGGVSVCVFARGVNFELPEVEFDSVGGVDRSHTSWASKQGYSLLFGRRDARCCFAGYRLLFAFLCARRRVGTAVYTSESMAVGRRRELVCNKRVGGMYSGSMYGDVSLHAFRSRFVVVVMGCCCCCCCCHYEKGGTQSIDVRVLTGSMYYIQFEE